MSPLRRDLQLGQDEGVKELADQISNEGSSQEPGGKSEYGLIGFLSRLRGWERPEFPEGGGGKLNGKPHYQDRQ